MNRLLLPKLRIIRPLVIYFVDQSIVRTRSICTTIMSPKPPFSPSQRIYWILDFDGTMTRHDTLDVLVNIAATTKPHDSILKRWKAVTQAYMNDYKTTLETLVSKGSMHEPSSIESQRQLLKELEPVEHRSLARVHEGKIFTSLTKEQIHHGAKRAVMSGQVAFRPCLDAIFRHAKIHGGQVNILSVNWSRCFIAGCLKAAGLELDAESILSNELDCIQHGTPSTGRIGPAGDNKAMIVSSRDKLDKLERIKAKNAVSGNTIPIVYVGDSLTDWECLLAADLGICVRLDPISDSQKQLIIALQERSISCPRLSDWADCDEWKVAWVGDLDEIKRWIDTRI